jgi:hypothetical protein
VTSAILRLMQKLRHWREHGLIDRIYIGQCGDNVSRIAVLVYDDRPQFRVCGGWSGHFHAADFERLEQHCH